MYIRLWLDNSVGLALAPKLQWHNWLARCIYDNLYQSNAKVVSSNLM